VSFGLERGANVHPDSPDDAMLSPPGRRGALGVDRLIPRWSVLDHLAVAHLRLAIAAEGGGNGPRGHAGLGHRRDNLAAFLAGQVASARARQEGRERRYAAAERLLAAPMMVLSLLIIPVL
jgi:hypothetical protein